MCSKDQYNTEVLQPWHGMRLYRHANQSENKCALGISVNTEQVACASKHEIQTLYPYRQSEIMTIANGCQNTQAEQVH